MRFDSFKVRVSPDGFLFCFEFASDTWQILSANRESWYDSHFGESVSNEQMHQLDWPELSLPNRNSN